MPKKTTTTIISTITRKIRLKMLLTSDPTARPAAATPPPQPELLWLEEVTCVEL